MYCYDLSLYNHAQLLKILKSSGFGGPIENVLAEKNQDSYSVQVSSDPVIIAQYAYEPVMSTHMVTVVGWDDTFAAENWPEDRRPPADGAWSAKNSWGTGWGDAGYHRLNLSGGLMLPAGARIGIVILETVPVDGGVKYALVNTGSLNLKGAEDHNSGAGQYVPKVSRYAKGIVNPGESFVSFENGKWTDWADAIASFGNTGSNADAAYDNLPVKAYIYPLDEVEKAHDLSGRVPTSGGEAAICQEDGYLLLDIAK